MREDPFMELLGIVAGVLVVALLVWLYTGGRRYFYGRARGWPEIRRDLYSGGVDEGMYPLDSPPDKTRRRDDRPSFSSDRSA